MPIPSRSCIPLCVPGAVHSPHRLRRLAAATGAVDKAQPQPAAAGLCGDGPAETARPEVVGRAGAHAAEQGLLAGSDLLVSAVASIDRFELVDMGEQENNKIGGGGGNHAMAVDEAAAAAKGKSLGAADPRLQGISDAIRVVPHFPKPGIMFNDITELLLRPGVFKDAVDMFVERYRGMGIAAVAGIEARGFIFGPAIALAIGAKFIPLRKPKKLPGEVFSESYVLEYGMDCLEMHVGAIEPGERVVVVDDLVATGGTLSAAIRLLERAGANVVECACLIGLPKFKDFYKLNGKPVYILVESRK
ncbi:hypothetical protein SORBI_3006G138800 [Sorghum bicolor]|uniref:adenine phosphoribosyltransferase n=2 Tax=Sorghum bicolor TaxID=4558 RepID=A0A1B6PLY9_SORBI|nr:hypothetical protein SORBI_3006G138800 [Sorghum bicolor]